MVRKENLTLEGEKHFGIVLPLVLISYFLILLNNSLIRPTMFKPKKSWLNTYT